MNKLLITVLLPFILGFGQIEESIVIYDFKVFSAFIDELDKTNIEFRINGTNQIFYPITSEVEVNKIHKEILSMFYSSCGGKFNSPEMHHKLIKILEEKSIPFRVVAVDEGEKIVCPKEYKEAFSTAFRSVMFSGQ